MLTGTDPRSAKFPCRSTVNFDDEEDYDPEKDKCVKTIAIAPKPENDEMCGFSMAVLDGKIYCVGGFSTYEPNAECWPISPRDCHFSY